MISKTEAAKSWKLV